MAEIAYTIHHFVGGNAFVVRWASLSTSVTVFDTGQPFPASPDYGLLSAQFSDKSVQILRASGTDTQVVIEGSNNPNTVSTPSLVWATLSDPQGNGIQQPSTGVTSSIKAITENCLFIRPRVSTSSSNAYGATVDLLFSSVRSSRSGI